MNNTLGNTFLITDVDGTLLNDEHALSEENLSAIRELMSAGGKFTIATGRGIGMSLPIVEELGLDEPAVIFNGAAVYDFKAHKMLWHTELCREAKGYLARIVEEFPGCAVEVLLEDKVYVPKINDRERRHLSLGNVTPVLCTLDDIPEGGWLKALIVDEPENISKIRDMAQQHMRGKVHWVRSDEVYYEMLPLGVNKGTGFKKLLELTGNTDRFIVAAGDFMNDIEMLEMADLGVAVANAQPEVCAAADMVTVSNNDHAIYEIVEHIKTINDNQKKGKSDGS